MQDRRDEVPVKQNEPRRFQVSDSEKLNDLIKLLEKNRKTLGTIYQEALEIITK